MPNTDTIKNIDTNEEANGGIEIKITEIQKNLNNTSPEDAQRMTKEVIKKLEKPKELSKEAKKFFENGGEIKSEDFAKIFNDLFNEIPETLPKKQQLWKDLSSEQQEERTKNRNEKKEQGLFEGIPEYNTSAEMQYNTYTHDMTHQMQSMPSMIKELIQLIPRPTINKDNYKNFNVQKIFERVKNSHKQTLKIMEQKIAKREQEPSMQRINKVSENAKKLHNNRKEKHPEERTKIAQEAEKRASIIKEAVEGKDPKKIVENALSHAIMPLIEKIVQQKKTKAPEQKKETISAFTSNEVQAVFGGETLITKEKQTENFKTRIKNNTILSADEKVTILNDHKPIPSIPKLGTETPEEMADVLSYVSDLFPERIDTTTINKHIEELRNNTITEDNQTSYNNILHIFATGERLSKEKMINQKERRTQEENIKEAQEKFENTENPEEQAKIIQETIDKTGEHIGGGGLSDALDALLDGNPQEAMKKLAEFFKYIMAIITGKDIDANEKLFNVGKIDFTNKKIDNLIGTHEKNKDTGAVTLTKNPDQNSYQKLFNEQGQIDENIIGENSLYRQIKKKKEHCGITKDIMYTTALSKLKDTLYQKWLIAKENNRKRDTEIDDPNTPEKENEDIQEKLKKYRSKEQQTERILANTQPGDLIFFVGGGSIDKDGKFKKAGLINRALEGLGGAGNHVGMIGPDNTIIHSTMKKYNTGKDGVHQRPLIEELNSRPEAGIIIARPKESTSRREKALKIAQESIGKIKYDRMDAINSLGKKLIENEKDIADEKKDNCATFIQKCYPQLPKSGIPAEIMESDQLDLTYTMQRQG